MTRAPAPLEQDTHAAIGQFLDVALPKNAHWFHVPNGGERTGRAHGLAKKLGEKPGEPDIVVLVESQALGIEVKRRGAKRSIAQINAHVRWTNAACPVAVCYDVGDVFLFLTMNGVKLRANVGV